MGGAHTDGNPLFWSLNGLRRGKGGENEGKRKRRGLGRPLAGGFHL